MNSIDGDMAGVVSTQTEENSQAKLQGVKNSYIRRSVRSNKGIAARKYGWDD